MPAHEESPLRGLPARVRRSRRMAVAARRAGLAPAQPRHPSDPRADHVLTTLDATIRPVGGPGYQRLGWAPGEPHVLRDDLGARPAADRATTRTSLLYVAHHTDVHVCDAQSPSRLEGGDAFGWANPGSDGGHRPQETFTTQVLDQLVEATNAVATSPLSGAPMAWCVQTGDNVDNRGAAELRWWVDVLDGREVIPNSGAPGVYEGIQRSGWRGAWHPDRAGWDRRSRAGFPHLPRVLDAGVAPFAPTGLAVPWLAVFGNHDLIFQGSFGPTRGARLDLLGSMLVATDRKPIGAAGLARALAVATRTKGDPARWAQAARGGRWVQTVTPDPEARRPIAAEDYVATLLDPGPEGERGAGPIGHGFTEANVLDATTWWSRWEGPHLQVIGLDTCNHTNGDGGGMGPAQTAWLVDQLERCHTRCRDGTGRWVDGTGPDRMVILLSHHAGWTMTNGVHDEADPGPRTLGPEVVALLDRFPNVVLWINGHTHRHTVQAHRRSEGGGWWELNTASGIDFGQQGRTVELFANGDGTLSIVATVLDHHGPPRVAHRRDGRWEPVELASLSRELAANDDQWVDPLFGLGSIEDRNVEMALPLPFPLT